MATVPRFSGAKNTDNTGRAAQRDYQKLAVTATSNLAVIPNAAHTLFDLSVAVATTINLAVGTSTTSPYIGDTIEMLITPDATTRVITWGTGVIASAANFSVTASKIGTANFTFNGTGWVLKGTSIQA